MADRFNMFSRSKPLPGWNRQSANADGEYYEGGRLRTIPSDVVTPPLRGDVFTGEELNILPGSVNERALGIESNANGSTLAQPPINRGYVPTGDRDRDITSYLTNTFSDPDEEDRLRRQTRNRMAIMAVGDAIRQMGNIYHTTQYAPSQKFNNPLENEYSRYYTQKRLRDADAYKKYTMQLQKDKLAAEQAQRDFQNQIRKDNLQLQSDKAKQAQENWQKTFDANQEQRRTTNELAQKRLDEQKRNSDRNYNLKERQFKDSSARGWANYRLSASRENRLAGGGSVGTTKDGKREVVYSPTSGASYSFPKGTFTGIKGKANIQSIYNQMEKAGLIDGRSLLSGIQRQLAESGSLYMPTDLSDDDKLALIMEAAGKTERGHAFFVQGASRLGYRYEGGMPDAKRRQLIKTPGSKATSGNAPTKAGTTSAPNQQAKAPAAKPVKADSTKKAPQVKKPATKQNTSSSKKSKKSYDNTNNLMKSWQ